MASIQLDTRLVFPLRGVSYDFYEEVRRAPGNYHVRMTYHDGTLEIMSPQYRHEKYSRRIGFIVLAVTSLLGITCEGAGSTTFKRRGQGRKRGWGKEPDQSFYMASASKIRGKDEIDLEVDPPPDLWIEVDHRGSSRRSSAALRSPGRSRSLAIPPARRASGSAGSKAALMSRSTRAFPFRC